MELIRNVLLLLYPSHLAFHQEKAEDLEHVENF